jgi:hypothetical protein
LGIDHPHQASSGVIAAKEARRALDVRAQQRLHDVLSIARARPGFYWGAGPVLYYPTATNPALGVNNWGSGPSAAFLHKDEGPWDFGAVVNNIWSFGGPTTGSDRTNQLFLNPIVNYHFGDGWSVGSSPEIATNWIASGGKWTVPVGGGFGKLFRVGGQALRVDLDSYYNAVRPQASNETWLVQLKLTFVFPDRAAVNSEGSKQ